MTFKEFIYEMAYPQSKAIEKIEDLLPQLSKHYLKCWIMPESRDYTHWKKEIINWLVQIDGFSRIKTKSKYINRKTFEREFNHITEPKRVSNIIDSISIEYDVKRDEGDTEYFSYMLEKFYDDLWNQLSSNDFSLIKMLKHLPK